MQGRWSLLLGHTVRSDRNAASRHVMLRTGAASAIYGAGEGHRTAPSVVHRFPVRKITRSIVMALRAFMFASGGVAGIGPSSTTSPAEAAAQTQKYRCCRRIACRAIPVLHAVTDSIAAGGRPLRYRRSDPSGTNDGIKSRHMVMIVHTPARRLRPMNRDQVIIPACEEDVYRPCSCSAQTCSDALCPMCLDTS